MHISASLLAADFARLGVQLEQAEAAGVDSFHFDWMDGHYVPNLALTPQHLAALRPAARRPFHVHLELANPDDVLQRFPPWNADLIVACLDTLTEPGRTLRLIRERPARVGLSLDPKDRLDEAVPFLGEVDLLLILGVFPGFGGQPLHPATYARLEAAAQLRRQLGLDYTLAVDGGVTLETAPALLEAGAEMLIVGTALFQFPDMAAFVRQLRAGTRG